MLPQALWRRHQALSFWGRIRSRNLGNPVRQILGTGYAVKARYLGKRHQVIPCSAYFQNTAEVAGLRDTKVAELGPPKRLRGQSGTHHSTHAYLKL